MNATEPGLFDGTDAMDDEEGSEEGRRHAGMLASQAAGIALVCSLALDAVAFGKEREEVDARDVADTASRLMFKCWCDLTVATGIMG